MLDDPELREPFLIECSSLLQRYQRVTDDILNNQNNPKLTEEIFIVVHSLKGNATIVGLDDLAAALKLLETSLSPFYQNKSPIPQTLAQHCLACFQPLNSAISAIQLQQPIPPCRKTFEALLLEPAKEISDTTVNVQAPPVTNSLNPNSGQTTRIASHEQNLSTLRQALQVQPNQNATHSSIGFECAFQISADCQMLQASLTLLRRRLHDLGDCLLFEIDDKHSDSDALNGRATIQTDKDAGAIARALAVSDVENIQLRRLDSQQQPCNAAIVARRGLMTHVLRKFKDEFETAKLLLNNVSEAPSKLEQIATVEIALNECGLAASALGFECLAAQTLELAALFSELAPKQERRELNDEWPTIQQAALAILHAGQKVRKPETLSEEARKRALTIRLWRTEAPILLLERAWLARWPDTASHLEAVERSSSWKDLRNADAFLAFLRDSANHTNTGRGRIRAAQPALIDTRSLSVTFWISTGVTGRAELAPVALTAETNDKTARQSNAMQLARPSRWGHSLPIPLALVEQWRLWLDALQRQLPNLNPQAQHTLKTLNHSLEAQCRERCKDLLDHLRLCMQSYRHAHCEQSFDVQFEDRGGRGNRRLLNLLKEPLTELFLHVLRHEVEPAEKRSQRNLDPCVHIQLGVEDTGSGLRFVISHDGIRQTLLLEPGTSLGLPSLEETFQQLGATISVTAGQQAVCYVVDIPWGQTLAIRATLVRSGGQPVLIVPPACQVLPTEPVCLLEGRELPVRMLSEIDPRVPSAKKHLQALTLPPSDQARTCAWAIDQIVAEEDVLITVKDGLQQGQLSNNKLYPLIDLSLIDQQ